MAESGRKIYRNSIRSEKAIIRAYVELMQNKEGGRISVTDIVNTADLNRSTFYAHFKSADDVRERIHTDVITKLLRAIDSDDYGDSLKEPYIRLRHITEFMKEDEEMYKMLLNTDGANKFLKKLRDIIIEKYLSDVVTLPYIKDRDTFEMNLRLFVGGYMSIVEDWAAGNIHMSLDDCARITSESVKACVERFL